MQDLSKTNIFSLLGLTDAQSSMKQMLTGRMLVLLEKRILVRVLDLLAPAEQEVLLRLLDSGSEEDRTLFLQKHVPGIQKIIADEVTKLKHEAQQFGARFAASAPAAA